MMNFPEQVQRFFWDVDSKSLDVDQNRHFVIERILEKGDEAAVTWLRKQFEDKELKEVVSSSRRLSPKSRNYWGLILHLWSTSNQLPKTPGAIWQN